MERSLERPRINFGPPKTFEEAIYRLPNNSHPRIKEDFELQLLSSLKQNIESTLKWNLDSTFENRMLRGITKDSLALMERWSFKRKKRPTRIYWQHGKTIQDQLFNMLPSEKGLKKRLYLYDMEPELDRSRLGENSLYKFVCIEAQYKDKNSEIKRKHEYLLGFVTQEEYDLLIEHKSS